MPEGNNVPTINKKLKTILEKLDQIVSLKQEKEFQQILPKLESEIAKIKGDEYQVVKVVLDKMVSDITTDISESDSIKGTEVETAKKMRKALKAVKEPLDKTDKVVTQLMENGFSEEELKRIKEEQKDFNDARIESSEKSAQTLVENSVILEEYQEEIEQIRKKDEIIKRIMREKDVIEHMDPTEDARGIDARKNSIRSLISQLENNGVDVSSLSGWESNMSLLTTFKDDELGKNALKEQEILSRLKDDKRLDEGLREKYGIDRIAGAKGLDTAYHSMLQDWSKTREKIQTLQAENQAIEETIAQINYEKEIEDLNQNYDKEKALDDNELADLAVSDATAMVASGKNAWENWRLRAEYDKDDRAYSRKQKRLAQVEAKNQKIEEINERRREAGRKEKKSIEPDENGRTGIRPIRWLKEKAENVGLTIASRTATLGKKRSRDFYDKVVDDYLDYHVGKKAEQIAQRKDARNTDFINNLKKSAIKEAVAGSKSEKDILSQVTRSAYKGITKTDYPVASDREEDRED